MKPILTHTLAIASGVLVTILWSHFRITSESSSREHSVNGYDQHRLATTAAKTSSSLESRSRNLHFGDEPSEKITAADLDPWLAAKKGDSHALAEAQAIAGLIAENPDWIRQAIELDPDNAHLLFIGATHSAFSEAERLSLSARFYQQDAQNGLAAFIFAAQLFKNGDTKKGIEILQSSQGRPRIDTFAIQTQLLMDDAYIAAGYSPLEAKTHSLFGLKIPYYSDLQSLVTSIHGMGHSLPPEQAANLRALSATIGMRLKEQTRSVTFVDHLIGLKLEEKTLEGLADDSPSPYQGITVQEARNAITREREELRKVMQLAPLDTIMASDSESVAGYIDRIRLLGEREAAKWWLEQKNLRK